MQQKLNKTAKPKLKLLGIKKWDGPPCFLGAQLWSYFTHNFYM